MQPESAASLLATPRRQKLLNLVEVLASCRPPPDPVRVIYPSKRHLSPRTRAFIDLLVERWEPGVSWEMVPQREV